MKMVVGLGNPGRKYKESRHNIGFQALNALKTRISKDKFLISNQFKDANFKYQKKFESEVLRFEDVIIAKPQTFMNRSGAAVGKLVKFYKIDFDSLFVVHDDLDITLGNYKIQLGKGPKIHNGLQSIYESLGSKDFWHVRLGIENRDKVPNLSGLLHQSRSVRDDKPALTSIAGLSRQNKQRMSGEKYVLQRFTGEEMGEVQKAIDEVVEDLIKRVV
jgi:PTH1 family peptidyl-tRNA hydrolase